MSWMKRWSNSSTCAAHWVDHVSAATDLRGLSVFLPQFTLQLFTKKERTEMKANLNVADVDGYHEQLKIILSVHWLWCVAKQQKNVWCHQKCRGKHRGPNHFLGIQSVLKWPGLRQAPSLMNIFIIYSSVHFLDYLIRCLGYKMSKNGEKYVSQSTTWHPQMSCFVHNAKIVNLLL